MLGKEKVDEARDMFSLHTNLLVSFRVERPYSSNRQLLNRRHCNCWVLLLEVVLFSVADDERGCCLSGGCVCGQWNRNDDVRKERRDEEGGKRSRSCAAAACGSFFFLFFFSSFLFSSFLPFRPVICRQWRPPEQRDRLEYFSLSP